MNPSYILPAFLGVCLIGVCAWNVFQTGKIRDLEAEREDLWADLITAVSKIPVRNEKGRFRAKAK